MHVVKLLTDLQILGCELHKNAFSGRALPDMGVNATGTLGGGLQVEHRRLENRGAVGGEGWGLGRGCAPSQTIYEFFVSKWCDMVHSGCVVFKIRVSH